MCAAGWRDGKQKKGIKTVPKTSSLENVFHCEEFCKENFHLFFPVVVFPADASERVLLVWHFLLRGKIHFFSVQLAEIRKAGQSWYSFTLSLCCMMEITGRLPVKNQAVGFPKGLVYGEEEVEMRAQSSLVQRCFICGQECFLLSFSCTSLSFQC